MLELCSIGEVEILPCVRLKFQNLSAWPGWKSAWYEHSSNSGRET